MSQEYYSRMSNGPLLSPIAAGSAPGSQSSALSHSDSQSSLSSALLPPTSALAIPQVNVPQQPPQPVIIQRIKRGSRACIKCRKAKARCEGNEDPPCVRCTAQGLDCHFEKPVKEKIATLLSREEEKAGEEEMRLTRVEGEVHGLGRKVDRVLELLMRGQQQVNPAMVYSPFHSYAGQLPQSITAQQQQRFPALPGYHAPAHPIGVYGVTASTTPSDTEDDANPNAHRSKRRRTQNGSTTVTQEGLIAPFEALADAAALASHDTSAVVQRKVREKGQIPPNAFPDVVTKKLVTDAEARDLFAFYMRQQHDFVPILDPTTDSYDAFRLRTPFTFDSIMSVACRAKMDPKPSQQTFQACVEEAAGIGRSTLFALTVRKEAVMAMTVQASFAESNYLVVGHALRMALELRMHKALPKLHNQANSTDDEARELVVCARIWLYLVWLDYQTSLSGGRPLTLHGEDAPTKLGEYLRFLDHPLSQRSDAKLVANVLLLGIQQRITLLPPQINTAQINHLIADLDTWFTEWSARLSPQLLNHCSLRLQYESSKILLYTRALTRPESDQLAHSLVHLGTQAAQECLHVLLGQEQFRQRISYASQPALLEVASSVLFVLQFLRAIPVHSLDLNLVYGILGKTQEVVGVLDGSVSARRFALTIKIASDRFKKYLKRMFPPTPQSANSATLPMMDSPPDFDFTAFQYAMPMGFPVSEEIPAWLQAPSTLWDAAQANVYDGHGPLESMFLPSWTQETVNGLGIYGGSEAGAW